MDDDLNTADALAAIFELVRAANTATTVSGLDAGSIRETRFLLDELLDVLGLQKGQKEEEIPDEILKLVAERTEAKKNKDFSRADAIRSEIQERGFVLMDTAQGPRISKG